MIADLTIAAAGSFLAGLLGGMVGLVLGSLRLPVILLASGNAAAAAGTNIAVSAAAALTGAVTHARAGRVDWRVAAWMTPPSVAAAFLGGYLSGLVAEQVLLAAIAAVLAWSGVDLLLELRAPRTAARPAAAAALAGVVIGFVGGAVGLILGTLRLPALLGSVGLSFTGPWGRISSSVSSSAPRVSSGTSPGSRSSGPCSASASRVPCRELGSVGD